jgi:dephospho-CoA kinase
VLLVGLTGGIGAGKSAVLRMLEAKGAVTLDADDLARRAVDPGTDGLRRVLERFGDAVRAPDGSLDRRALAQLVFDDEGARRDLEAIVHPEVARLFADAVEPHRATDDVVVYAVPLLVESNLAGAFDLVMAVTAPEDERVRRVTQEGRLSSDAARARMRAQATDAERQAAADVVVRNDGSLQDLRAQVDALWPTLLARAADPR